MSDKEKKNWFMKHKVLAIVGVLIILVIIGAVINKNKSTSIQIVNTTNGSTTTPTTSKSTSSNSPTGHVGSTLDIGGSSGLAITLNQVIDPATGNPNDDSTPNPGYRYVAVELTIQNNGSSSYSDDANSDVNVIGSDNQTYTFDTGDVTECTNFNEGDYTLGSGENASGCVVFQLPTGVNTAKVQFTDESAENSTTAEWLVP